ncbi:unnamed protein product [Ilex paraguariensis]
MASSLAVRRRFSKDLEANCLQINSEQLTKVQLAKGAGRNNLLVIGRFSNEVEAARAHDLLSLKYWGDEAKTNFPISMYGKEVKAIAHMTEQEVLAYIRR